MIMQRIAFVCAICVGVLATAGTAQAQYGSRQYSSSSAAVGEDYHVEFGASLWNPERDIVVTSESLGIQGTPINAVTDLGFQREKFGDFKLVLRPSERFKFRFGYTPIRYQAESVLKRDIIFNGQKYSIGLPVNTDFNWKDWRFGIQYDFVYGSRGFAGFIAEVKYTDVRVDLVNPLTTEFSSVKVPVPTIGGAGRVYIVKNLALNFELTGLKITYKDDTGKYIDFDVNGTYNIVNNFGVAVGYRRLNVDYVVNDDTGDFDLKGIYLGAVARF